MGIEPTTYSLGSCRSTTELRPRGRPFPAFRPNRNLCSSFIIVASRPQPCRRAAGRALPAAPRAVPGGVGQAARFHRYSLVSPTVALRRNWHRVRTSRTRDTPASHFRVSRRKTKAAPSDPTSSALECRSGAPRHACQHDMHLRQNLGRAIARRRRRQSRSATRPFDFHQSDRLPFCAN